MSERRWTMEEIATAYLKASDDEVDATRGACEPGELYKRFHQHLEALPASKMENRKVHSYIATADETEGFRDGTISQVWLPVKRPVGATCCQVNTMTPESKTALNELVHAATRELLMRNCPYAVGDILLVKESLGVPSPKVSKQFIYKADNPNAEVLIWLEPETMPDEWVRIRRPITSVEAKTLGEMNTVDMWKAGLGENPEFDFGQHTLQTAKDYVLHTTKMKWNARYPEQPWDTDLWCWTLGLAP